MPATPTNELLAQAKCFICVGASVAESPALALLDDIGQKLNSVPPVAPDAPAVDDLTVGVVTAESIFINWTESPDVLYAAYQSAVGPAGPWTLISNTANDNFEYFGLTENTQYWLKVTSRGDGVVYSTTEVDSNVVDGVPYQLNGRLILSGNPTPPFDIYVINPTGAVSETSGGYIYASAKNCVDITSLDLSGNSFSEIDLSGSVGIESLNLSGNPLTGSFTVDGGLPALLSINLSGTDISEAHLIDSQGFGLISNIDVSNCPNLNYLDLEGNDILDQINIDTCPALLSIFVSDNPVEEMTVDYILATCDASGLMNGNCALNGTGPATPSAAGLVSAGNLTGKGWSVGIN